VLQPENLHGDLEAAPSKALFRVGTKTGNIELLGAPRRIAVESSLEFVLKIADHDLFNAPADGAMLGLEVGFVGKEISKQGAEILVDIAGSVQTACLLLDSLGKGRPSSPRNTYRPAEPLLESVAVALLRLRCRCWRQQFRLLDGS
jgi:hypothetical protein